MKCPKCKANNTLLCTVSVVRKLKLIKGGGISTKGIVIKQTDLESAWESVYKVHGGKAPVTCEACNAAFFYVKEKGLVPAESLTPSSEDSQPPSHTAEESEAEAETETPEQTGDPESDEEETTETTEESPDLGEPIEPKRAKPDPEETSIRVDVIARMQLLRELPFADMDRLKDIVGILKTDPIQDGESRVNLIYRLADLLYSGDPAVYSPRSAPAGRGEKNMFYALKLAEEAWDSLSVVEQEKVIRLIGVYTASLKSVKRKDGAAIIPYIHDYKIQIVETFLTEKGISFIRGEGRALSK